MASPSASMTSCGRDAFRPGPESVSGGDHLPSRACVAATTTRKPPCEPNQATTVPPSLSIATTGAAGVPTGSETTSEADHLLPIVLEEDRSTRWRFCTASQTALTCPAFTATLALKASSSGAERSSAGLQSPPAGLTDAWMTLSWPVERCQTATAFPSPSIASAGDSVAGAGAEIRFESQSPPAGLNAGRTADVSPSNSRQIATTFPAPSDAIRGRDPVTPAGEMSVGWSSAPATDGDMSNPSTMTKPIRR
jgi:hypothetical protein